MSNDIPNDSWSGYSRLVLKELERLSDGQTRIRRDMELKFDELNKEVSKYKKIEDDVLVLKEWKQNVSEVWSTTQMSESKNEIYEQKNKWQKVIGVVLTVQAVTYLLFNLLKFK